MLSCKELKSFEKKIASLFKKGKIKAPIHLSGGNEEQLIKIFKGVKKRDWIFSTWRNHYHWLLSGRSKDELERQIRSGHSMHVNDVRFFTSAIVGGIAPIAVGVAYALKQNRSKSRVWCFLGDMAHRTGIVQESIDYASGHGLPITFVVEDNDLSVNTVTNDAWGNCLRITTETHTYFYSREWPHSGTGDHVLF